MDLSKLTNEELLKLKAKFAGEVSKKTCSDSIGESRVQDSNPAPISIPKPKNYSIDFDLNMLELKELDYSLAKEYVSKNHYSGCLGADTIVSIGFFYDNELVTVICYGNTMGRNASKFLSNNSDENAELRRLFSKDGLPKNTESYCLSQSFKYLKIHYPKIKYLISYADTAHGHIGYIYQATNWKYIGQSKPGNGNFVIDGKTVHPKTLYNQHGTSSRIEIKKIYGDRVIITDIKPKNIYLMCLGNYKERKEFYAKFNSLPYPKAHEDMLK